MNAAQSLPRRSVPLSVTEQPPAWPRYVPPPVMRTCHNPLRAFAGPYNEDERWMLDNAIADLRRARRRFLLVRETESHPDLLSIFVR